jgi:thiamine phosphate synthase YjbQ (UPF0047 family)
MQAHIKSALVGASVTIPIKDGKLVSLHTYCYDYKSTQANASLPHKATGTWQGIWYLEFRASKHTRRVMATIQGEKA